jgi:hypothetical protein
MTTFIDFLEEIEQSRETVTIPADEAEVLAARFGPSVRSMGFWNKAGDRSIEIPMSNVVEAVRTLCGGDFAEAVSQLKSPGGLANLLDHSSARKLIEALSNLYLRQFQNRVEQFQDAVDSAEAERLWGGISSDLFGE